jgi:hypothetical protein
MTQRSLERQDTTRTEMGHLWAYAGNSHSIAARHLST